MKDWEKNMVMNSFVVRKPGKEGEKLKPVSSKELFGTPTKTEANVPDVFLDLPCLLSFPPRH